MKFNIMTITTHHRLTKYKKITPEYVKAALWLIFYGFNKKFSGKHLFDGAYARQIILNELTFADRIYVIRPLNERWQGKLPSNLLDLADFVTELWFNASYREQCEVIDTINNFLYGKNNFRLVKEHPIHPDAKNKRISNKREDYHRIRVIPVEIQSQRGFFDYFVESPDVFDRSYERSLRVLEEEDEAAAAKAWPRR